ncbi:MAG: TOTE conflict system archaeo-eukaryotic primase domain-containing protein [Gemmobacter sp.]
MNDNDLAFLQQVAALADPSGYSVRSMIKGKWGYLPVNAPITDGVLTQHLSRGEDCIGIRMNVDGGEKSRLCIFDFDDHDAEMDQPDIFAKVKAVSDELTASNVPHLCFRSGGGQGAQVWIVFAEPRRTDLIRDFADHFLKKVNLTRKAGGKLINGEVEVLPKGSGAQIVALPYGRKSAELMLFDDGTHMLNTGREIEIVPYAGKKSGRKQAAESSEVDRDAAFDCFIKKYDVDNRDWWGAAGICLVVAFGKENTWARDRFIAWSKTSAAFKHGDEKEWDRLSGAQKYTPLSFWRFAKEHGYTGKTPFTAAESRRLLAIDFLSDVKILRDQSDVAYAELKPRDFVRIDTGEFKEVCALALYRAHQRLPDEREVKGAQMIAQATARESEPESIALRFAKHGGKRYVFLADKERTIIEIDEDGWRVNNDAPVMFRKGVGLPMAMPEPGSADELAEFLNLDEDAFIFLLAWMVTAIINPAEQCPITILEGPAGSAKSSTLATIVEILDPKVGAQSGEPQSEEDLVVSGYGSAVMSFDNVSTLARLSDALCRLSTGGGMSKRKLYSDGDVFALDAMRPVLIAGIDPTFYRQDLIERIVRVDLKRPAAYMDEETFRAARREKMPRFRGALFSLVAHVLGRVHLIKQTSSRFGVFTRVGECIAQARGREEGWFVAAYDGMRMKTAMEAGDADSVLIFLVDFLGGLGSRTGTFKASTLHADLREVVHDLRLPLDDIPKNARIMGKRIMEASTLLSKAYGWRVDRGPNREFVFTKDRDVEGDVEGVIALAREARDKADREVPF